MKSAFTFFLILLLSIAYSQEKFDEVSVQTFQNELISEFADSLKTPLTKPDFYQFKGLEFYPVNPAYFVNAKFIRTKDEKPFAMKTTGTRTPMYVKYGELHFKLDGKDLILNVYQNIEFSKKTNYDNGLFLPFTDLTSGNETYGGGRYIDLTIPKGETIAIDFNKAYNPYCAYNHKYSCPIVPKENDLKIEVKAGVKKFHD